MDHAISGKIKFEISLMNSFTLTATTIVTTWTGESLDMDLIELNRIDQVERIDSLQRDLGTPKDPPFCGHYWS